MAECRGCPTPLAAGEKLQQDSEGANGTDLVDQKLYQEAAGTLTYSAITTRPDIAYASGLVGRYADAPPTRHWKAIKRILRYLKETKEVRLHRGIVSEAQGQGSGIEMFADADFAGEVDTMKLTTGIAIFDRFGALVAWKSKRQTTVAKSTADAEFNTTAMAVEGL
jgi:hypothetical protein